MKKLLVYVLGVSLVAAPSLFAFSNIILSTKKNYFNSDSDNAPREIGKETIYYEHDQAQPSANFNESSEPRRQEAFNVVEPTFSLTADKSTVSIGEPVTIKVTASAKQAPFTVYWLSGRDSDWTQGGTTFLKTPTRAGTEVIKAVIKDANGNYSKTKKIHITVLPENGTKNASKGKEVGEARQEVRQAVTKYREPTNTIQRSSVKETSQEQDGWFSGIWKWLSGN